MYFARIESSPAANKSYNDSLKAAAARRLGDKSTPGAKKASMLWNEQNKWANGAKRGSINRKQARKLEARVKDFEAGSQRPSKNYVHTHHRPGSFN